MPLIYLPLIMYASWMQLMTQPFTVACSTCHIEPPPVEPLGVRTR
jgi:hypothetical protein